MLWVPLGDKLHQVTFMADELIGGWKLVDFSLAGVRGLDGMVKTVFKLSFWRIYRVTL
jgi:hypothetical protein